MLARMVAHIYIYGLGLGLHKGNCHHYQYWKSVSHGEFVVDGLWTSSHSCDMPGTQAR